MKFLSFVMAQIGARMKIEVIYRSIVKQPDAEAVVNSVITNLRLGSGVASVIHTAASPWLEVSCRPPSKPQATESAT